MVLLHYLRSGAQAGITRYAESLADALEAIGVHVDRVPVRPYEFMMGKRRTGGYASMQLQNMVRPVCKRGTLHSAHFYAASPRADVVTVHDCFPEQYEAMLQTSAVEGRYMAWLLRRLERRQVHYITPTQHVKKTFMSLHPEVPNERIHVTYEGIDERFVPSQDSAEAHAAFPPETFNVLMVGDLNPRKRLDWVLQAAVRMDEPRLRIVHVGTDLVRRDTWAKQRMAEQQTERQLSDRFIRLGHVDDETLVRAYQSADLFVLPSLDEGFGLPPLEALRCGTPVAVTDIPVFREVLGDRATYFDGPDQLQAVLQGALDKGPIDRKARLVNHGFVADTYAWPEVARRTNAVYEEACP